MLVLQERKWQWYLPLFQILVVDCEHCVCYLGDDVDGKDVGSVQQTASHCCHSFRDDRAAPEEEKLYPMNCFAGAEASSSMSIVAQNAIHYSLGTCLGEMEEEEDTDGDGAAKRLSSDSDASADAEVAWRTSGEHAVSRELQSD